MPGDFDHGCAFEFDDLWRDVLLAQKPQGDTIFAALPDTHIAPLKAVEIVQDSDFFNLNDIGLGLPRLEHEDDEVESFDHASPSTLKHQQIASEHELEHDLWNVCSGEDATPNPPKLFTWEEFTRKSVPRAAFLSEAGPASFNAALSSIASVKKPSGLLPRDYTLRACCSLVLGRGSSLFRWDDTKQRFVQNVDGTAVDGLSHTCSASLMQLFLGTGSTLRRLRVFAELAGSARFSYAALLAFKSCITSVLNAIEEHATRTMSRIRTLVQLQHIIAPFDRLLSSINTLVKDSKHCSTDESLISTVSDHVHNAIQTEYDLLPAYRCLLARVSAPWLEKIAQDVGLRTSATVLTGSVKAPEAQPGLVDKVDQELIEQTAAAVGLLRDLAPDHSLLHERWHDEISSLTPASDAYHGSLTMPSQLSRTEHSVQETTHSSVFESKELPTHVTNFREPSVEEARGKAADAPQDYLQDMNAIMSEEPVTWASNTVDEVYDGVLAIAQDCSQEALLGSKHLMAESSISPFEQMRPMVQKQHRQVNGILLRQLFKQHKLRQHLQLQRAFHLLGNADFVDRLSMALFSSDVQSAERRRGTIPTGQLMGLRLGTTHEERWPPASSELRLTLTGILNDAYRGTATGKAPVSSKNDTLPGGLSFSIRELREHEIDRVLDPNSIFALDFLRLQYAAEAPINAIITTDILSKYDEIFRFLLKLLRLIHVSANLTHQVRADALSGPVRRLASHANHFISVLMSHIMGVGVDEPWTALMRHVHDLEQVLSREDAEEPVGTGVTCNMESLRQAHETCLERIRTRLFLKRRQEKVRLAIEGALASILSAAFTLQSGSPPDSTQLNSQLEKFHSAAKEVCTLLVDQVDRLPKSATNADFEDAEAHKILLARLNWNGHYF
ncbi:hypothetical protein CLAFUW4_03111 [Fulvia fulva]|uniref:Spindle pole body component n=1 Tax=Passalora fulva TaxID=5499 RepID=A0A9Q8L9Z8_PASFU|nr:uncharacterized protein CLAFUR5_03095 [Fulvia fulva]KAK4631752.1 hypothetical protein CLAFUR4_03104 [Fulvia fulva]KAK4633527.1 hypothetical protein CLAFUR0_03107 [Fulvia fulva]UJO13549.1 hypothetical protein CLAFUR5_03095 [Fulvia fulva]WPV10794.1 hypothetical protein CLAFUW4_03111 [Fulvia fulva]WPV26753.1 hypothetical protein CLAFUW7_03108 [Fulvia fulva]